MRSFAACSLAAQPLRSVQVEEPLRFGREALGVGHAAGPEVTAAYRSPTSGLGACAWYQPEAGQLQAAHTVTRGKRLGSSTGRQARSTMDEEETILFGATAAAPQAPPAPTAAMASVTLKSALLTKPAEK